LSNHNPGRLSKARPFVKWAGGKKWLAGVFPTLVVPECEGTYYEPFLGGGSGFFALQPNSAVLSDINSELMNLYDVIKVRVDELTNVLLSYEYSKEFYYKVRGEHPNDPVSKAARTLYLNRTCWNGLYRTNKMGQFNVPFGRYKNPTICNTEQLRAVSDVLQRVTLRCVDFEEAVETCTSGDFVYFDPPYSANHNKNGFSKYNGVFFTWEDQLRLSATIHELDKKRVWVLLSNTHHPSIVSLYEGFRVHVLNRPSRIAGKVEYRRDVQEYLISNYPLGAEE